MLCYCDSRGCSGYGGTSLDVLIKTATPLRAALLAATDEQKTALVKKMAAMFKALHSKGVVHADAHGGNIVYKPAGEDGAARVSGDFRLIDFAGASLATLPTGPGFKEPAVNDLKLGMNPLCSVLVPVPAAAGPALAGVNVKIKAICDGLNRVYADNKAGDLDVAKVETDLAAGSFDTVIAALNLAAPPPAASAPPKRSIFNMFDPPQ